MGDATKTRLFHDMAVADQELLVEQANLRADEDPVIAYLSGDTRWSLVTNQRLIWLDEEGLHDADIFDINRVTHDMGVALQRGQLDKRQFHELTVEKKSGEVAVVELEAGKPFYGVWRALYWMLDWANRPEQKAIAH